MFGPTDRVRSCCPARHSLGIVAALALPSSHNMQRHSINSQSIRAGMQLARDPALPHHLCVSLAFWGFAHFKKREPLQNWGPNFQWGIYFHIENYSSADNTQGIANRRGVLQWRAPIRMAQHVPGTGTTQVPLAVDRGKDHRCDTGLHCAGSGGTHEQLEWTRSVGCGSGAVGARVGVQRGCALSV
eukprot:scaffold98767_cov63-Phaeocystis_antarctica.AAC.3